MIVEARNIDDIAKIVYAHKALPETVYCCPNCACRARMGRVRRVDDDGKELFFFRRLPSSPEHEEECKRWDDQSYRTLLKKSSHAFMSDLLRVPLESGPGTPRNTGPDGGSTKKSNSEISSLSAYINEGFLLRGRYYPVFSGRVPQMCFFNIIDEWNAEYISHGGKLDGERVIKGFFESPDNEKMELWFRFSVRIGNVYRFARLKLCFKDFAQYTKARDTFFAKTVDDLGTSQIVISAEEQVALIAGVWSDVSHVECPSGCPAWDKLPRKYHKAKFCSECYGIYSTAITSSEKQIQIVYQGTRRTDEERLKDERKYYAG